MCGRNLESINHVLWECQDESVAGPRKLLVEKLMRKCAHLDDALRALMTALWSLGASDSVKSANWMSLKTNLTNTAPNSRIGNLARIVHKVDAALVKLSADPTELCADNAGMFGPGG